MTDPNQLLLKRLLEEPGNNTCADCGDPNPEWASVSIGVFICLACSGIHRDMGAHISKIKSTRLDKWDKEEIESMKAKGNLKCKQKYEFNVPVCYRRPNSSSVPVMRQQWIRSKYERQDFTKPTPQPYLSGYKEGYLWKRGRDDDKFNKRRFVLSEAENAIKYFVKDGAKEPKASIGLDDLNVLFAHDKVGENGLQLTFGKDGQTRNLFIYAESGQDIIEWYTAIRSCKLNRLRIAFPLTGEEELLDRLSRDFLKEGFLSKTGPKTSDGFKERWFTLDTRKLMYFEDRLNAFPKGEVFLGNPQNGFAVREGVPPGYKDQGFSFTLKTPDRSYVFSAQQAQQRTEWMDILNKVINTPMSPKDSSNLFLANNNR